ncbi:SUMF1/EgtB/PvdO family nonheme iron enzyme [bacterium]|nr:SUMF1/EgtB/PvdO family nonheme iron enzyme [bacterium]
MTKIFISYRRADSQYVTDSIHEFLIRHFGEENVFLDVGSIPFGVDFRQYLAEQIAEHDVVLVIIGPDWARIMQERADQDNDFVRIEIESALKQGKLVVPVLVMEARMPSFNGLPAGIADLQWRNSATVRRKPDLEGDCARLADGIKAYFNASGPRSVATPKSPTKPKTPRSLEIMPAPFAWIDIPAGRVTLENNMGTHEVPAFAIAKYPITNAQFAKFIEAGGYSNQSWWTEAGWEAKLKGWEPFQEDGAWKLRTTNIAWTEPRYWRDSQFNGAEQPVVGVSWYEAIAFCRWLSEASGEAIMLPTEQQWQRAAQGDDGRRYPWGNDWDCQCCNNSVSPCDSNQTTPVTHYEGKGDSPYGVVDMGGNVWEWCLTEYDSGNQGLDGNNRRVLRGGSWYYNLADGFRAASRLRGNPDVRYYNWGFRVSRSY